MTILETERLTLRKMIVQDEDHLMKIFSDPIAMQYYTSTKTREDAQKWINWNIKNYEKHQSGLWICELKETGKFIGQCGIVPQTVDGQHEMEIGYLLSETTGAKDLQRKRQAQCVTMVGIRFDCLD